MVKERRNIALLKRLLIERFADVEELSAIPYLHLQGREERPPQFVTSNISGKMAKLTILTGSPLRE